ncbi:hypothetical protein D3C73_1065180 [compost metagenome]
MPEVDIADMKAFMIQPGQIVVALTDDFFCRSLGGRLPLAGFNRLRSRILPRSFPLQNSSQLLVLQRQSLVGFHQFLNRLLPICQVPAHRFHLRFNLLNVCKNIFLFQVSTPKVTLMVYLTTTSSIGSSFTLPTSNNCTCTMRLPALMPTTLPSPSEVMTSLPTAGSSSLMLS